MVDCSSFDTGSTEGGVPAAISRYFFREIMRNLSCVGMLLVQLLGEWYGDGFHPHGVGCPATQGQFSNQATVGEGSKRNWPSGLATVGVIGSS
jgi:hypothetical protein